MLILKTNFYIFGSINPLSAKKKSKVKVILCHLWFRFQI